MCKPAMAPEVARFKGRSRWALVGVVGVVGGGEVGEVGGDGGDGNDDGGNEDGSSGKLQ